MELFVTGRLCLFGEHSDWASGYRCINTQILPGAAIVTGIEQGIYARAEKSDKFRFRTVLGDGKVTEWAEYELSIETLKGEAKKGGFFSYVAGVAAYMLENYDIGGISVDCYDVTIPIKKGLSSSAAVCVLIARAFNHLYNLQMSVEDEMEAAYRGEILTPSRCGRLDQTCAYGTKPVLMHFDGDDLKVERLTVGKDLYWVFCDLAGEKNTRRILSDLNACYPHAQNKITRNVQRALGEENQRIVAETITALRRGDAVRIGQLMDEAQHIFDTMVAPACPSELTSPLLHRMMSDPKVRELALGVKGVGSQGDGTVQMICSDENAQQQLIAYLQNDLGLDAYAFRLKAQRTVRKAVIPLAGMGTRLYPETKVVDKAFFPIVDYDGITKPAILVMLEELVKAGIEEIGLIIQPSERENYDKLFKGELNSQYMKKLTKEQRECAALIEQLGEKITYIYQEKQLGFGHAVYQAKDFSDGESVLLMLGDHLYHSESGESCTTQMLRAYEKTGMMTLALDEVELERVHLYGILHGKFIEAGSRQMQVDSMVEKPTAEYASERLGVADENGEAKYYCVFGQYILPPRVFELLERKVEEYDGTGEIELTTVLDEVRAADGMMGYLMDGKRYDIGVPEEYRKTLSEFGR